MEPLDIGFLINESIQENGIILESVDSDHVRNIFEDERLTFGEIRDIFGQIFNGKTNLYERLDGFNLAITNRDGIFGFARNKSQLRDPMDYDRLASHFDGDQKVKEAFVNSANDLGKALNSIDSKMMNRIFRNGHGFLNVQVVYPPMRNIMDYGNRCLIQLNNVDEYDGEFNRISQSADEAKEIFEQLRTHNALKQDIFEISVPNAIRIKESVNAEDALKTLNEKIDALVDGIGYRATIQDYVNDRLKKYIVNSAMKYGIDVGMHSDFVNEFADRISNVSHRRPTKTDLVCYAKKDGINPRSQQYLDLIQYVHANSEDMNDRIMAPIESLVMEASSLLFKSAIGFLAADPSKNGKRITQELDETVKMIESDDTVLTKEKMRRFRRNLKRLDGYRNDQMFPSEGVVFSFKTRDGVTRVYKLTGGFGPVSSLLRILKH